MTLAVLTGLGAILRAIGLDGELWFDEILTLINSVRQPLLQIVTLFPSNNQHTLYSVLAHFSIEILGEHPWSLRLPAFLFGVATIPLLYMVGLQFTSRAEALLTSSLLAFSYHHIWFSQNARGYSALAFWALLATFLFVRTLTSRGSKYFVLYAVVCALGVYTHLTMVFLVLGHVFVWGSLLLSQGARKDFQWRRPATGFALAGVLTVLFYSPLIKDVHQFFLKTPNPIEVATPIGALLQFLRGMEIGMGTSAAAIAAGLLLLLGLWSYFRQSPFTAGLFLVPGVLMVMAAMALQRPTFPRFLFFLIGFGLLIMVRGAMRAGEFLARAFHTVTHFSAPGNRLGIVIVVLMIVASTFSLRNIYLYPKQDFEQAMRFVNSQADAPDIIVSIGLATLPYRHYYQQPWESVHTAAELEALLQRGRRVWLVYTLPAHLASRTPALLDLVEKDFSIVKTFPGTLNGGEVVVCKAEPFQAQP